MTGAFQGGVLVLLAGVVVVFGLALHLIYRQVKAGRRLRGAELGALAFAVLLGVGGATTLVRSIGLH